MCSKTRLSVRLTAPAGAGQYTGEHSLFPGKYTVVRMQAGGHGTLRLLDLLRRKCMVERLHAADPVPVHGLLRLAYLHTRTGRTPRLHSLGAFLTFISRQRYIFEVIIPHTVGSLTTQSLY